MGKRVAVIYNKELLSLDMGEGHPLRGDRYSNFLSLFNKLGLDRNPNFEMASCRSATEEDLLLVHSPEYIKEVDQVAASHGFLSPDTPVSPEVVKGAILAVGGALEAGRRVCAGENGHAVCFGGFHHAGRDYGGGFCVFNDVAILAKALVQRHGKKRIMVLDTDAHAGDGTQEILSDDPSVLMVTLHQDPTTIYPGRGFPHEIGRDRGTGFTVNIPLPLMAGLEEYQRCFQEVINPLAREFRPQVLIRNGGSDPHYADELTHLGMSVEDFRWLGAMVRETAGRAPMVDMYGSGYNPVVLPYCWMTLMSGTTGINIPVPKISEGHRRDVEITPGLATQKDMELEGTLAEVKRYLKPYWKCFQ